MKKKFLFIVLTVLTFSPSHLLTINAQRLTVKTTTIDVGATGYEQPVTATFEMRNKGLRRLVIQSVKPDCGCTQIEYPKEVGIGERFTIKMTYDARQLGHFQKMCLVKSNGTKKPFYLTMKGVVSTDMKDYSGEYPIAMDDLLLDKSVLEFDDVNKGDVPVAEIHILNNSKKAMRPNLMHLPPYLQAITSPDHLLPGRSATITVKLLSEKLRDYGLTKTTLYMAHNPGDKVKQEYAIDVATVLLPDMKQFEKENKELAPKLQMSTTDVDFTDFGGKAKKSTTVTLQNNGKSNLKITSLQLFTAGLKVTLSKSVIAPGQTANLKITGTAEELLKLRTRPRILMITNDPDHAKVVVNIKLK
jgi:archaellum component FlaF (FlaF/FlaG flagellin family)